MPSDQKDVSKSETRTHGSSIQASSKDTQKNTIDIFLGGSALRTSPFGSNLPAENIYKRAERIVAAIHLVTAHVQDREPIRIAVRDESLHLLRHALTLRSELRTSGSENVLNMLATVRELISFVRILGVSGRVSSQNVQLIVDALDDVGNLMMTSQRSALAEAVALSRDDFAPAFDIRSGHVSAQMARFSEKSRGGPRGSTLRTLNNVSVKDNGVHGRKVVIEARTTQIMDILRRGGLLGIKDISANLPEYSEKMIQRDLATLVHENRVRKMGAKRWSKYELVR